MTRAAQIFPKGGLKAKLYTFGFALIGYSVLVLSLNNRNLNHYEEQAITDATISRAVTSNLNSSPSQAAANSTLRANQTKMHTNLSSVLLSSDYQSHVEEKYLLFWPHGGFSNQVLGLQRAAQIAYASKRTLVLPPVFPHHTFKRDLFRLTHIYQLFLLFVLYKYFFNSIRNLVSILIARRMSLYLIEASMS